MANPHYIWPDHVLIRTTAPDPIVSLADAKAHLRVDFADDDAFISGLVMAAEAMLDGPNGMVGKAIATQRWTLTKAMMVGRTRLPIPVVPFRSVVSLKYYDIDNVQQTADLADFVVFGNEDFGYIEPIVSWPLMYDRPNAIELIFEAGFGDVADVPKNLVHAAKMMIGHWYEDREQVSAGEMSEIPLGVYDLVNISRIGWVKA